MSPRWRNLPSLSSLRAFDATARNGGFAGAGRVLNVTHAAVTQQVRGLEEELGVQLVRRTGRSVTLTEAGQRLAQSLGEGFGTIVSGIEDLQRGEERRPLRVSTTTFIAEAHILPRLPEFWALHPGIEVAMAPGPALVDFVRDGFDLAVRAFGDDAATAPGEEVRSLVRTPMHAVCSPELARTGADPRDLPWISGPGTAWDHAQLGKVGYDLNKLKRVEIGSPHLEMSAARQGLGATLATEVICRDDLAAGRLVVLPVEGLPAVIYAAVMPKGPRRPAVDQFVDWLATTF
jgi:LysR family glycine cleavage system transcriptional activator